VALRQQLASLIIHFFIHAATVVRSASGLRRRLGQALSSTCLEGAIMMFYPLRLAAGSSSDGSSSTCRALLLPLVPGPAAAAAAGAHGGVAPSFLLV